MNATNAMAPDEPDKMAQNLQGEGAKAQPVMRGWTGH